MSNNRAIAIFSHLYTDMGEKIYAQKFKALLPEAQLYDISEQLGSDFISLATLNLDLARLGYTPLVSPFHLLKQRHHKLAIVLSWSSGIAAMCATNVMQQMPTIAKLYAHQKEEKIFTPLYESASLLITESLLASELARKAGLTRVLYIPHHFTHQPKVDRSYIKQLAKRLNKPSPPSSAIIVGCVSRLEYWKNPEFAIEAIRQLQGKYPLILVLKGDFPRQSVYPDYEKRLEQMLNAYQDEPWLFWDRQQKPYPEVLSDYAAFDISLQPSGAEGASNVVVELMAMGKPVIVLDATTNPYLFQSGVCFAAAEAQLQQAQLSYARPILDSLKEQMERLCDSKERQQLGLQAQKIALERFHPQIAKQRMQLMLEAIDKFVDFAVIDKQDRNLYGI